MPELLSEDFFVGLSLVLATNIILSGDNAVVIAMAARRLEGSRRRWAILWGAAGAVVLRLIFAAVIAYLIAIPFLQAAGGILLFWIAWKLVHDGHNEEGKVRAGTSVWDAIRIIILADAVMSLDNVVALVSAAPGSSASRRGQKIPHRSHTGRARCGGSPGLHSVGGRGRLGLLLRHTAA